MRVRKAVFVVAGFGTRFLPVTKTVPKEMLPIVDKPIIHYAIEEALDSGITDLIFVVSRNKKAIEDYLDVHPELEELLKKTGKESLLPLVSRFANSANIFFVRQPGPFGTGDAVLRAESIIGDEPFMVIYPDDVFLSEIPFTKQMMEIHDQTGSSVLGLEEVPQDKVSAYGVIRPGEKDNDKVEITEFVEKPKAEEAPSNLASVGRYLLTPNVFKYLKAVEPAPNGEYYITNGINELLKTEKVYGKVFKGRHFDTGNKIGYLKANLYEAYQDPSLRGEMMQFIGELSEDSQVKTKL